MSEPDCKEFCGCWIVIPAYNEGSIISRVLSSFDTQKYRIVVVDDGSTDDTVMCAKNFPVTILRHLINLGQGAALQTGINYALQFEDTKTIVTFDADGQHTVEDIDHMLMELENGYDVVLGSRFINQVEGKHLPRSKKYLLYMATIFTRWSTGLKITDTHNGLRAFRADAIRALDLSQNRMAHASEILTYIAKKHLRYCEVPVNILYTDYSLQKGQSIWNSINILWEIISEKFK